MKKRYRYYRAVLEVTSVPLAILWYIYILTGYCIINEKIVSLLTFGLLKYKSCLLLHSSVELRWLLITLTLLHFFTGFSIVTLKIRNTALRTLVEKILAMLSLVLLFQFLMMELL